MATKKGKEATQPLGSGTTVQEEEENGSGYAPGSQPTSTESNLLVDEVPGQVIPIKTGRPTKESTEAAGLHEEVKGEGEAEAGEEFAEASPEQLAAVPADSENAYSDFRGIEGFEEGSAEGEESAEAAEPPAVLTEAGAEAYGQQEFLPILATLASTVLPTLASSIGPKVAKAVANNLAPRALKLLRKKVKLPGILGTVARLFEAAEQRPTDSAGGESEGEVEEAIVAETTALMETVIGIDDRLRIRETTKIPWRRISALRIYMPSGKVYRGSAFFIGARVLATAGHCVFMHDQGGWARRIEVIPGCDGNVRPFAQAMATTFRSTNGWTQARKPESDYGCIVLPPGAFAGQTIGSFGFGAFSPADLLAVPAVVAGYPGDRPFAELWGIQNMKIKTVTALQLVYNHDTYGGQSGCPVFIKKNGKRYVVGIHNYGAATGNSATRITVEVFNNLRQWRNLGTPVAAVSKMKAAA